MCLRDFSSTKHFLITDSIDEFIQVQREVVFMSCLTFQVTALKARSVSFVRFFEDFDRGKLLKSFVTIKAGREIVLMLVRCAIMLVKHKFQSKLFKLLKSFLNRTSNPSKHFKLIIESKLRSNKIHLHNFALSPMLPINSAPTPISFVWFHEPLIGMLKAFCVVNLLNFYALTPVFMQTNGKRLASCKLKPKQ